MISIVTAIDAVIRSRTGDSTARKKVNGSEQTRASSTCRSSPIVPATVSPMTASIAASRTGRARANISLSSCTQTSPSAAMPAANTQSPK